MDQLNCSFWIGLFVDALNGLCLDEEEEEGGVMFFYGQCGG